MNEATNYRFSVHYPPNFPGSCVVIQQIVLCSCNLGESPWATWSYVSGCICPATSLLL